jgi:hypothetical protein
LDWQVTPRNTFIASYSENVNHLENVGVGGTALADTGYDSRTYEHMFRLSDVTTASAHFMHEARLSLRWDGEDDLPVSTAPQVQVTGAFTSGGANIGPQRLHELNIEADDDLILTTKNHTLKFGTLLMIYNEHQQLTTNFNGTYTFGGGTAPALDASNNPIPGRTEIITGFEQYRRALLNLAGGTPTAFSNVAGNPSVAFTQVQDVLFLQDDWNLGHSVHIASGVRYFVQNDPAILDALTPRLGISWSPDQKGTWTLHAHIGTFSNAFNEADKAEVLREDGIARVTSTIYNPIFGNPFLNATPIHSVRQFAPHIGNSTKGIENVGASHAFPHNWTLSGDFYRDRFWNALRSENINSPFNDLPTGPRPGAPNLDVLQMQNSGQGRFDGIMVQLSQESFKSLQSFVEGYRAKIVEDSDNREFFTPQSSSTDVGEFAQRSGVPVWEITANGALTLPKKSRSARTSLLRGTPATTSPPASTTMATVTSTIVRNTPSPALRVPSPRPTVFWSPAVAPAFFRVIKALCHGPTTSTPTCSAPLPSSITPRPSIRSL